MPARVAESDYSIVVARDPGNDEEDRDDFHNPLVGGQQIRLPGTCTSNIGWYKGTEMWAVTAGHCVGNVSPDPRAAYWHVFTQQRNWTQGSFSSLNSTSGLTTYILFGGRGDLAVTRLNSNISLANSTITHVNPLGVETQVAMNWWEWSPALPTASDETPFNYPGDVVCQAGINWSSPSCGTLLSKQYTRTFTSPSTGLWTHFHDLFEASYSSAGGDSGGTVWTVDQNGARWLSGVHRGLAPPTPNRSYTHISEVKAAFGLTAPIEMW